MNDLSHWRQQMHWLLACMLLLLTCSSLRAVEGIDMTTGGHWRDPSVKKPWSVDGKNVYGTDGHYFFNVSTSSKKKSNNRPIEENRLVSLPDYITQVTPAANSVTASSNGYLKIDHPTEDLPAKVESGLLIIKQPKDIRTVDALQIKLGKLPQPYGIRIGILINNADKLKLSPQAVSLRTSDGNWKRRIIDIPDSLKGTWVFFNVPATHSGQSLILSLSSRNERITTLGGLIFDAPISEDPQMALSVTTTTPIETNAEVVWKADIHNNKTEQLEWTEWLAQQLLRSYRQNKARLQAIEAELATLPVTYGGEPTGSGGYLTSWQSSAFNRTRLMFKWQQPVEIDAVALLPLRLYLGDEAGLTENAYWPNDIEIRASVDGEFVSLAHLVDSQQDIRHSLPEFVTFEPIQTQLLEIRFTNLPKRMGNNQYAGGFSEIFVFSGKANIAPRARLTTNSSREGYRVFSRDYLTDEQTPLGLPEIGPRSSGGLGFTLVTRQRLHEPSQKLDLIYPEDQTIDAVRLDPAVIYKPGQAFPVRFTIELLDADENPLVSDNSYREIPLRNPGLNPYTAHFPATSSRIVRLNFIESSQPTELSRPWIQLSEMTPLYQGSPLPLIGRVFNPQKSQPRIARGLSDPSGIQLFWSDQSVYDGMTQSGKLLPHREWLEGLNRRQRLLEEQKHLSTAQVATLKEVRLLSQWITLALIVLLLSSALYYTIHHRLQVRREMRDTRERIASDLHDDVGSNLGTINIHTEYLMDQIKDPAHTARLKAIFKLAKESSFGLREVLHTTAPRIGRSQNLLPHLEELTKLSLFDVQYSLQLDPASNTALSAPLLRKDFLLFYKEALYNIQHHAACSQVQISLQQTPRTIELTISDNGVGMSQEKLAKKHTLRTLKLRAKGLKAELQIQSEVNQGTHIRLSIPHTAMPQADTNK
ncbi:histidine kinase [Coraliomargarita algicola]|uniref:Histidine kinase n=1 Tax=Coraliomargarita algicola TaxID=3092156 RepID=A0ABZ0RKT7_9BACT|nr:histidine kinase [Coraliomargarita sp. J2-16]WPJ95698.1 histidine kinase [Coraliomargarita sp. J2-16]